MITSTEFKQNYGKYVALAEKETVYVTKQGKVAFSLVPGKQSRVDLALSICGIIPEGATIGEDPYERG